MDIMLENFHFLRPLWFLLLMPLTFLLYQLWQQKSGLSAWKKVCDPGLLDYLKVGEDETSSWRSLWLFALAALIAITALAGPVWQELPQPVYRQQSALVILFDVSRSMDATDIKPSRLIRAKQKINDLLKLRQEGQTALVAFAGTAYVVTPLTEDNQTILSQLQGLTPDIMPQQGGNIDAGIEKALLLLTQASVQHGQVLLLTDSQDFSTEKVQALTKAGHDLSVIGVGTVSGAPIPKTSGGFLLDQAGNIVVPQLHESRLQDLAKLGLGVYRTLSLDERDIQPTLSRFERNIWTEGKSDKKEGVLQTSDQWREEGPWLLLLLIPLALIGFRRGVLALACCILLQPASVEAGVWTDLWQTKDQQAQHMMKNKQFDQAAQTFKNSAWKASAAYRNQDYETALTALDEIQKPTADDWYNKGNILAKLKRWDESIQAYAEALKVDAKHEDAKTNKALVEKIKQQQTSQSKKQEENQQSKGESEKNKQEGQQSGKNSAEQKGSQQKKSVQSEQQTPDKGAKEQSSQHESEQTTEDATETESKQRNQGEKEKTKPQPVKEQKQRSVDDLAQQELSQAFEQSLRRIPDDPSGLLRRKFLYQYQHQSTQGKQQGANQW